LSRSQSQAPLPFEVAFSEPSRFKVRASGEVTFSEIERLAGDLLAHPRFGAGAELLVDADAVEGVPSVTELRVVASQTMPTLLDKGLRQFAIVASNPFVYGMARVFSVFAETAGGQVATFRKLDEAGRWLDAANPQNGGPRTN
jgi:hypothetical protein